MHRFPARAQSRCEHVPSAHKQAGRRAGTHYTISIFTAVPYQDSHNCSTNRAIT
jgi:hypothetical protein